MEESKLLSRKRRRPSSTSHGHPFSGIFTRSKSLIYLHRHRSGRARADSFRRSNHHAGLRSSPVGFCSNAERPRKRPSDWDKVEPPAPADDWPCNIQIKDLRARRVHSLPSSPPPPSLAPDFRLDVVIGDEGEVKEEGYKRRRGQRLEIKEAACSDSSIDANGNCLGDAKVEGNGDGFQESEKSSGGDGGVPDRVGALGEDCLQATPPDAETHGCFYENQDYNAGFVPKQKPLFPRNGQSEGLQGEVDNHQKVIKPRCRVKVFKSPGSLSYKRLLPYLMDIAKDDPCLLRKAHCANVKNQNVVINKSDEDNSSIDVQNDDSKTSLQGFPSLSNGFSYNSEATLSPPEPVYDSPMPCNSIKVPCISPSFVPDHCPKPVVDQETERIVMGDKSWSNLNGSCSSSGDSYSINGYYRQVDNGDTKRIDAQNVNRTKVMSSSTPEDNQIGEDDVSDQHSDYPTRAPVEGMEVCDVLHPCKATNPENVTPNLYVSEANRTNSTAEDKGDSDDAEGVFDAVYIQSTPLDADMLSRTEVKSTGKRNDCVIQRNQVLEKPLHAKTHLIDPNRMESSPRGKLSLKPCSQMKLFKPPSSFSYRRLLPYLMDITKDNSGASENKCSHKLEERSEQNPPSGLSTSKPRGPLSKTLNCQSSCVEHHTNDSHSLNMSTLTTTNHTNKSQQQPNLTSAGHNTGNPMFLKAKEGQEIQVLEVTAHVDGQLKAPLVMVRPINGSSSPFGESSDSVPDERNVNSEEDCRALVINPTKSAVSVEAGSCPTTTQIEVCNPLKLPENGPKKGILKRNPRGCRGICTCLNCSSFLLHAQRAFEFSKNQMQDAEEVALDLIKELSHLRNALEKSALASNDCALAGINQVKVACRKAVEAEELAKGRLMQMKDDLGIHCRITCGQRPTVRFANDNEEKIIQ